MHLAFGFLVGLCFGSFANVLIYRLPRNISLISPRSFCTACNGNIQFYDLLPVVSWVLLKGRCRSCHANISSRYPLIELACAFLFMGMILTVPGFSAIFMCLLAFILLAVSFIDADTQEIPDSLLGFATVLGVTLVVLGHFFPIFFQSPGFISAGMGILIGGGCLLSIDRITIALHKKDGFGYGDVKLMAVCGIFLGWPLILVAFFFAFISGGIYATYLLLTRRARRGEYIAFGPFLCAGMIAAIWIGQDFISFIL